MRWPIRKPRYALTPGMRVAQRGLSRFLQLVGWDPSQRRDWNDEVRVTNGPAVRATACGDREQPWSGWYAPITSTARHARSCHHARTPASATAVPRSGRFLHHRVGHAGGRACRRSAHRELVRPRTGLRCAAYGRPSPWRSDEWNKNATSVTEPRDQRGSGCVFISPSSRARACREMP